MQKLESHSLLTLVLLLLLKEHEALIQTWAHEEVLPAEVGWRLKVLRFCSRHTH